MHIKIILLASILTLSCSFVQKKEIMIIGIANNAKAGAVVVADDDKKIYYLDGVDFWDKTYYGKKVKVTGELIVENNKPSGDQKELKQEIIGIKRIIKKPRWILAE